MFIVTITTYRYKFLRRGGGLYVCDLTPTPDILISTVEDNASHHTKREIRHAAAARQLQEQLGNPSDSKPGQALANG